MIVQVMPLQPRFKVPPLLKDHYLFSGQNLATKSMSIQREDTPNNSTRKTEDSPI